MGDGAERSGVTPRSRLDVAAGARRAVERDPKASGTTAIAREVGVDELDYDDVGPTTIELPSEEVAVDPDPSVDSFDPPVPGDVVGGRYRLDRVLGRGAAGIVYEATHLVVGKRVAIKCLYPFVAQNRDQVARFFREARIAAGVDHPNVVHVFDGGTDGDLHFLVMELVSGEPLSDHFARGLAPVVDTVQLFLRIAHGVSALHEAGVVHRDLKPDNVLLAGPERAPKVLDFGISKLRAAGAPSHLTTLGAVMGTPYYMAPEQVTDTRNVDARADVYSLGVMLYEALTGRLPYEGESVLEIYRQVTEGRCVPAHHHRPEVPPALSAAVAKALRADREDRYADVRAMREALAAVSFDGRDDGRDVDARFDPWRIDDGPIETAPTRIGPTPAASGARPVVSSAAAARAVAPGAPPFALWLALAVAAATSGALAMGALWLLLGA